MTRQTWLSGTDTAERWQAIRDQLDAQSGDGPWRDAFAFLKRRLETRYLEPIRLMQEDLRQQGEGFAIVSLQCALIEFFAALVEGRHYVHSKTDAAWDQYAYNVSGNMFVGFLRTQEPFSRWLASDDEGKDFYQNVRCGLVHEAMTKKGWRINTSGDRGFSINSRVVYRDTLQRAIEDWLAAYQGQLAIDAALRAAFVRKLNHVAA